MVSSGDHADDRSGSASMISQMTKRERVEAALNLQEVDRVPVYDLLACDAVIEHYAGEPLTIDDGLRIKCKAINRCLDLTRSVNPPNSPTVIDNGDGWVHRREKWTGWIEKRPFDDTDGALKWLEQDMETRNSIHPGEAEREQFRRHFLHLQSLCGDTVIMHECTGVGIESVYHLLGWDLFSYVLADYPDIVSAWLESYTSHQIRLIHVIADYKLSPVALPYGDIAYKGATIFSPVYLRREFMPRLKRINDAWHEHGIKCMFHSDGYLMEVLPDLIETGIDGLNPIEVCAGMSVKEVKDLYGDRIFIAGGIDVSQLLPFGTPDEIRDVCAQAIRDTGGIGYLMGSTTELINMVPAENYRVLVETAWQTPIS
ncbi:MAG: uroporphyrinogen decarboxylase family protein [Armatimonadota bacterium]